MSIQKYSNQDIISLARQAANHAQGKSYPMEVKVICVLLRLKCHWKFQAIADMFGTTKVSINNWINDEEVMNQVEVRYDLSNSIKNLMPSKLAMASNLFLDKAMSDDKIETASFRDLMSASTEATKLLMKQKELDEGNKGTSVKIKIDMKNKLDIEISQIEKEIIDLENLTNITDEENQYE